MNKKHALLLAGALVGAAATAYILTPDRIIARRALGAERALAGVTQRFIDVQGTRVRVLESGPAHAPVMVMIHGFGANADSWVRLIKKLGKDFRMVAFDLPGFGSSDDAPDGRYDVMTQVKRVEHIMNALGLHDPVTLVGHSMGGYIAGTLAAHAPTRVEALWMIAPLGVQDAPTSEMLLNIYALRPNPLLAYDEQEYEELLDFVHHKRPFIPAPVRRDLGRRAGARVFLHKDIFKQMHPMKDGHMTFEHPLEQSVARVQVPILVTWGECDRALHVEGAMALSRANPAVRIQRLRDVGHMPIFEAPAALARMIRSQRSLHLLYKDTPQRLLTAQTS